MKAIVYTKYGSPDVLQLQEVEKPAPGADEVLVRIHAVSVNAMDWHLMRGKPLMSRFVLGLLRPKAPILGADIAGRVEAVGPNVTQFQPGDVVFGGISRGGFAEYGVVPEKSLALKPANVSCEAAAAVPIAALTALQALRDNGQIQAGQTVLINGASGGVGTFAVQLAKAFGAEVTGVCSPRNLETARQTGADYVIDYTQEDFTRNGRQYDLIVDIAANRSVSDYTRALKSPGIYVVAGFSTMLHMIRAQVRGSWASRTGRKKFARFLAHVNQKDLLLLKEMLETGQVVPVIDRCYPLGEVAQAIRHLEGGHPRGKVVVTVAHADN